MSFDLQIAIWPSPIESHSELLEEGHGFKALSTDNDSELLEQEQQTADLLSGW